MRKFKKSIAVVLTLIMAFSMFCWSSSAAPLAKVDVAFVIDTTYSMYDDISEVQENMRSYLDDLYYSGMDFRVAVIDYRDFSSRTGDSSDYPYCVQCNFTDDYETILDAINSLTLGDGGDYEETVYSAIIDGLDDLSWRSDAGKTAILMGDAPALDPEPITGYTSAMAIAKLEGDDISYDTKYALDASRSKITVFGIATSTDSRTIECFEELSSATGGETYTAYDSEEISGIITEIIDTIPDVVVNPTASIFDIILDILFNIISIILSIFGF